MECTNPSWLELTPDQKTLFAVRESFEANDAALVRFSVASAGNLNTESLVSIEGEAPCHLAFDRATNRIASAQYGSGDIAICSTRLRGLNHLNTLAGNGSGPNENRQEGPHAHFVCFTDEGQVLHGVDLGADKITSYRLSENGTVRETQTLKMPAGSGPRHMALTSDDRQAWIICELDESLIKVSRSGIGWKIDKQIPAFDTEKTKDGTAGAIRLSSDEKHFYVSGRRQSCIAAFNFDGDKIGEYSSGGEFPRDLVISSDGKWVVTANQHSNTICCLKRDPKRGKLGPPVSCQSVDRPVSLTWRN